ncbi:hypothetical protein [Rhodobacter maris]|uniref:LTXXQ motif family protein n=1 Tax=Rhodobacter maris TaxID=446682 RepID=A0A285SCZ3_9RHOB|nr:hypothetical protein [Rhodobacter maris]SOC05635.1 hypothetical protein SAMN05877831_104188 [Rhodobacter maris]
MSHSNNHRRWTRVFVLALSGVAFCSQAVAAALSPMLSQPPASVKSGWSDLRARLEKAESGPSLDEDLLALVAAAGTPGRVEAMVRQSYAMAGPEQIAELDQLWVDTLVRLADTEAMQSYISIRSSLTLPEAESEDYYLQNWLWRTTVPAGCDGD